MNEIELTLAGLTCKSCIDSVNNAVQLLPGIINCTVTLTTAVIEFDKETISCESIIDAIENSGFVAKRKEMVLAVWIKGMTCMSCVNSIKNALQKDGIISVDIDLKNETGRITYLSGCTTTNNIIDDIENCGFDAGLLQNDEQSFANVIPASPVRVSMEGIEMQIMKKPLLSSHEALQTRAPGLLGKSESQQTISNPKVVTLQVHGMTCASCVASIENYLLSKDGIYNCSVALAFERAQVEYSGDKYDDNAIADMIDDMGFEAKVIQELDTGIVDLQILGMTCASCSGKIEKHFRNMEGVNSVSINLLAQTGQFDVVKKLIGVRDLIEGTFN